jgi:hypothetical protein
MSKRFDKQFPKMDLISKNIVSHSKTFDEIPFYFDELTFWHYQILPKYYDLPFCTKIKCFRYSIMSF